LTLFDTTPLDQVVNDNRKPITDPLVRRYVRWDLECAIDSIKEGDNQFAIRSIEAMADRTGFPGHWILSVLIYCFEFREFEEATTKRVLLTTMAAFCPDHAVNPSYFLADRWGETD